MSKLVIKPIDVEWFDLDLNDWSTWPWNTSFKYFIVAREKYGQNNRRVFHVFLEKVNPCDINDMARSFHACDANGHECENDFDTKTITHWTYAYFNLPPYVKPESVDNE